MIEYESIQELYAYQQKIKEDGKEKEEYDAYLQWMYQFYAKESMYTKEYEDGKCILILKSNPSKKIVIEPAQFVSIPFLYNELKKNLDDLYYSLIDKIEKRDPTNKEEFEELQEEYKECKEKIKETDSFQLSFADDLLGLLKLRIEKSFQLSKYYQHRKTVYGHIASPIEEKIKNKIIGLFKKNKCILPSQSEINQFSKKENIPSKETEKWLEWTEQTYLYMKIQKEIHVLSSEIIEKEKEYENQMEFFLIQKPTVLL